VAQLVERPTPGSNSGRDLRVEIEPHVGLRAQWEVSLRFSSSPSLLLTLPLAHCGPGPSRAGL